VTSGALAGQQEQVMHKSGEGYWTRTMTAIAAGLIAFFGAYWIWEILVGMPFGRVPSEYVAGGAALLIFSISGALIYYFVGTNPRSVDFLVATEAEMKKVNWSTRREIIGSTQVVLMLAFFIAMLAFVFDRIFFFLFVWLRVLDPL
jgi:preprotein translocase SecE subunit